MQQLSHSGQQAIDDIARRHGFGTDAVLSMLQSVINGNGRMAQFNHPEFSGSGQWMSGGMTMVSDMFNNYLKGRVNSLCAELAQLVANQPDLLSSGSFQSQSQGGQQQDNHGGQQSWNGNSSSNAAPNPTASLFIPPAPGTSHDWWGPSLRWPNSTGAQNGVRYAYFAQARRLAIELNGQVTIYDTLDHQIGGFSQQQSYGGSITFNSQYGLVDVNRLPVVAVDGVAVNPPQEFAAAQPAPSAGLAQRSDAGSAAGTDASTDAKADAKADIFGMIDKLAELRGRAILSEEEFIAKKTELLSRL